MDESQQMQVGRLMFSRATPLLFPLAFCLLSSLNLLPDELSFQQILSVLRSVGLKSEIVLRRV